MDERARKLIIAGVAVALFVGFIFLTRWTGDDPGSVASFDDAEKSEIAGFCAALSSGFVDYETGIRLAAGLQTSTDNSDTGGIPGSTYALDILDNVLRNMADKAPPTWAEDAHAAAEGLSRAFNGKLTEDQISSYVAHFEALQHKADKDCDQVKDVEPSDDGFFGNGDGSGFSDEEPVPGTAPTSVP